MFEIILEFLSGMAFGSNKILNTKKIDENIMELQQYNWFNEVYLSEQYRKLFFANFKVRKYLQSNYRVKKMIKRQHYQKRFIYFLNKQL